ncbi:proline-serine-threonine phosphatase-interacting protein 1-like isoform X3 [Apostichopus japonicus]|uniref:proline-serine-threonine phosphatase-interacting protein 1-like isoform X3 n=1 Tax=Stichopus japonicus TaxID=307972 RepID=UPI003AB76534
MSARVVAGVCRLAYKACPNVDPDIAGTQGFETLVKRLKEGSTVCKEIEDFLKNRSQAEVQYGKALSRCSQQAKGKDEIGGLKDSWDEMVKQSENEGLHHNKLGNAFHTISKNMEEFRLDQKERRTRLEDGVKRLQSNKRECYHKVLSNKDRYENKCRDADAAIDTYDREEPGAPPAMKVKLVNKRDKAKKAAKDADDVYKKSLELLEDSRKKWELCMTNFCQEAQKLEEDRIHFLRDELWEVTNHVSQSCVIIDEVQEEVRKVLEKCVAERDIHLFVQQKRTGTRRPDRIEYESYYQDERAPQYSHLSNGRHVAVATSGYHNIHNEPLPSPPSIATDKCQHYDKEDIYSSVPDTYAGGNAGSLLEQDSVPSSSSASLTPFKAKVTYQYTAQDVDELSLEFGQMVTVLSNNNTNWWLVEFKKQQGKVPSRYLEPFKKILV